VHRKYIPIYIQQDATLHSSFYPETAPHVSGGTSTHHQEHINVYGSVHRKYILIYIQQDASLHSLFYPETALHVWGGTITHHQERTQLYLKHHVTPLLLPAASGR
jgi:hypothetical protein